MKPDKLKSLLDGRGEGFLTVQQHRKLRKALARKRVELVVVFTGGEYLELVDSAQEQSVEEYVAGRIRADFKARTGHALGYAYDLFHDDLEEVKLGDTIGSQSRQPTRIVREDPPEPA